MFCSWRKKKLLPSTFGSIHLLFMKDQLNSKARKFTCIPERKEVILWACSPESLPISDEVASFAI